MSRLLTILLMSAAATLAAASAGAASAPMVRPAAQPNEGGNPPTTADAGATLPPPPPETPGSELPATIPSSPAVAPVKRSESFAVHHLSTLVLAPASLPLDQEVTSFARLTAKAADRSSGITTWGEGTPEDAWTLNYQDSGFSGVAGYYHPPGATPPWTMENSVSRGVDFKYRFQDRKGDEVNLTIEVNDNRATPAAADHRFQVKTTLKSDAFKLVKLGEPQECKQAWLAITADGFADTSAVKAPVTGTLSADGKVAFKFTSTDGQEIDTTKMRGKVILVDYWATWCGPCVESLPRVEALFHKFHDRGLEVLGVSLDDEQARVDIFMKHRSHPWPQAPAAACDDNELAKPFHIQGIPFYLLIDRTGTASIVDARDATMEGAIVAKLGASDQVPIR